MKHLLSAIASADVRASTTTVCAQVRGLTAASRRSSGHSSGWLALLLSALLCVVSAPAFASVVTYTDESAWREAAGTYALENFDGFTAGAQISTLPSLGLALDKLGAYNAYPAIYKNNCGGSSKSGLNTLVNFGYPCVIGTKGDLVFRQLPGSNILAMGYWNTGGDDSTKLAFFDANNTAMGSITAAVGLRFVGLVSTEAPTLIRITAVAGNLVFSIDDLQVAGQIAGRSSDVPAPQTFALMLAGLMLVARGRRGRHAASNAS